MKNDKVRLFFMATITIILLATIALYGFMSFKNSNKSMGEAIPVLITLIVIAFMAFFILRRYKDVKEGMPMEDERSKKVITQAAAKSFYISLYWLLAISWFEGFFAKMFNSNKLDASQTVGGGIAGMTIFFLIFWVYYDRKGKTI